MMDKRYFIQRQPAGDSKRSAEQLIGGLKAAVVGTHADDAETVSTVAQHGADAFLRVASVINER
jgi:hypothetical protein